MSDLWVTIQRWTTNSNETGIQGGQKWGWQGLVYANPKRSLGFGAYLENISLEFCHPIHIIMPSQPLQGFVVVYCSRFPPGLETKQKSDKDDSDQGRWSPHRFYNCCRAKKENSPSRPAIAEGYYTILKQMDRVKGELAMEVIVEKRGARMSRTYQGDALDSLLQRVFWHVQWTLSLRVPTPTHKPLSSFIANEPHWDMSSCDLMIRGREGNVFTIRGLAFTSHWSRRAVVNLRSYLMSGECNLHQPIALRLPSSQDQTFTAYQAMRAVVPAFISSRPYKNLVITTSHLLTRRIVNGLSKPIDSLTLWLFEALKFFTCLVATAYFWAEECLRRLAPA